MAQMAGMVGGALLDIAGNALLANEAGNRLDEYQQFMGTIHAPNVSELTRNYFGDLSQYAPQASELTQQMRQSELTGALKLREQALPGITGAVNAAAPNIYALMQGKLPDSIMNSFMRAGGASSVGLGFGGSQFGALNTGLFGARGSLGGMQTGFGLLGSLMSTMPQVSTPSPMSLLSNLMTPEQRSMLQLQSNQQQIGLENTMMGMPTPGQVWGTGLKQAGAALMGSGSPGGSPGGGGGGGGMGSSALTSNDDSLFGGFSESGINAGGYERGGPAGGWGGGSIWGGAMAA